MQKIAIVGLGYWGVNILRNFYALDSVREILIYDIDREKLNVVKNNFPNVRIAESFDVILKSDVNGVVIATNPLTTHFELGKLVLNSGKHLWLEKPLAASSAEARDLIDIAARKNVLLHVDNIFIYSDRTTAIKEILDREALGNIKHISMTRVNILSSKVAEDAFLSLSWHDLYLLFYWFGNIFYPNAFHAERILNDGFNNHGHIFLTSSSGITATLKASFVGFEKVRKISIFGDRKILFYNDSDAVCPIKMYDLKTKSFEEGTVTFQAGDKKEPLLVQAKHFMECMEKNIESKTSGAAGLAVIELLESIFLKK